jgi:hypothetical protein
MDDVERAQRAVELLEGIDSANHDSDVRDTNQNALATVNELAEMLVGEDIKEVDIETPDGWDDEDEWKKHVEEARENSGVPPEKGTLTTKTIDNREYYYLQWREGEQVKSQYVAPVSPS